ncbi:hypothetical protein RISK_004990 [Rhodopirellula islandica]|uniref:Uncharacterized protein n=1 Tax=Rhodopirellula islandica TaxID=595434 RepID=A0A0J1B871_RHOIS|nr:hypothetical protein RISK_004990 [Rhodopirellula islandica]
MPQHRVGTGKRHAKLLRTLKMHYHATSIAKAIPPVCHPPQPRCVLTDSVDLFR